MADHTDDTTPGLSAPIMPTGSGIADLEIAREQDAMAEAGDPEGERPIEDGEPGQFPDTSKERGDIEPTLGNTDAEDSAAHPS